MVGVSENAFYVTNDHNEAASRGRTIKDLLQIGMGNVCYFDGQKMSKTGIEGLKYANGINRNADGSKIFVAESTAKKIWVFDRDKTTGQLKESDKIFLNTGCDNIELDPQGNLWVGCHPQMLKFLAHSADESKASPSEIVRIDYQGNGSFTQKTIYINDGIDISASSVGAFYHNKLLIRPVFQNHIIVAQMK